MRKIAMLPTKDREALFRNTAGKIGVSEAVVEKDFWVCWMLDYLFQRSQWKVRFAFKGGTSLSKSYGTIDRFSEDIDLILDWRVLGYGKDEPWLERSNTKQDLFNKEVNERSEIFLQESFLAAISEDLSRELCQPINCYIESYDPQTVKFEYPNSFSDNALLQEIRLEIVALAEWTPAEPTEITPYAAQVYGRLFEQLSTKTRTVSPERTFWEKATILHREAYRPIDRDFPSRYSRHYYDLYRMAKTPIKDKAFADKALLERVVRFKEKFYRCPWAHYELAKFGTMRLMPPKHNLNDLQDDYRHMKNMLFGEKPSFDDILTGIKELEKQINCLF